MSSIVAGWPPVAPFATNADNAQALVAEAGRLASAAQYGWGHTIDFGAFRIEGLFGEAFLGVAALLDEWRWWPERLDGMRVADVGCFSGGMTLLMATRGAECVYAVDEVPEHLDQCRFVARTFDLRNVTPVCDSLYRLEDHIEPGSLDVLLVAGVLYHLSDMLVGLHALRRLLKPSGVLLMESAAIEDFERSYADFARFVGGGWWVPSALCVQDMLGFMNFADPAIRFYTGGRCLVRAPRGSGGDPPFRRGLNWRFESIRDEQLRSMDLDQIGGGPGQTRDRTAK